MRARALSVNRKKAPSALLSTTDRQLAKNRTDENSPEQRTPIKLDSSADIDAASVNRLLAGGGGGGSGGGAAIEAPRLSLRARAWRWLAQRVRRRDALASAVRLSATTLFGSLFTLIYAARAVNGEFSLWIALTVLVRLLLAVCWRR